MEPTGLSSATCMLCSGRPNSGHLILRSTSGLLGGGAAAVDAPRNDEALAAVDDAPKNDEALLCRLEMPIVGGADPKEKGLGEGAGAWGGSSGMRAPSGRCLHSLCRGWKERTFCRAAAKDNSSLGEGICPRISPLEVSAVVARFARSESHGRDFRKDSVDPCAIRRPRSP